MSNQRNLINLSKSIFKHLLVQEVAENNEFCWSCNFIENTHTHDIFCTATHVVQTNIQSRIKDNNVYQIAKTIALKAYIAGPSLYFSHALIGVENVLLMMMLKKTFLHQKAGAGKSYC